jgi:hypothetical protein
MFVDEVNQFDNLLFKTIFNEIGKVMVIHDHMSIVINCVLHFTLLLSNFFALY